MKKILLLPLILLAFTACKEEKKEIPTNFTEAALNDTMTALDGTKIQFKEILEKYKGNPIVIDVWASWCTDCVKGMPKVHELQAQFPNAVYLFLSYDKTPESWKEGIEKYEVKGEHYFLGRSEWKGGTFSESIELDWIPRYMLVDKESNIAFYYAKEADNEELIATLKTIQ